MEEKIDFSKGIVMPNFSSYVVFPEEGKVWSYKTNRFIGTEQPDGYYFVTLYGDEGKVWNTHIHRVIYTAVHGEIPKGYEINHIDEDKSNCSIFNLSACTPKENCNFGTRNKRISEKMTNGKLSKQVAAYKDNVLVMVFPSTAEAERNGYNHGNISQCCNGKLPHYKSYTWKYLS